MMNDSVAENSMDLFRWKTESCVAHSASIDDYFNGINNDRGALKSLAAPPLHPSLVTARMNCAELWMNHILYKHRAIPEPK